MGTSELLDHSIIERFISVPSLSGDRARSIFPRFLSERPKLSISLDSNLSMW
jgi:hypothetical protein